MIVVCLGGLAMLPGLACSLNCFGVCLLTNGDWTGIGKEVKAGAAFGKGLNTLVGSFGVALKMLLWFPTGWAVLRNCAGVFSSSAFELTCFLVSPLLWEAPCGKLGVALSFCLEKGV